MSISLFSAVIILIFSTVAFFEIRRGRTLGFFRSLVSLGTLILSVLAAFALSTVLADGLFSGLLKPLASIGLLGVSLIGAAASFGGEMLTEDLQFLVQKLNGYISGSDIELVALQNALASMISSFLFVLIFFLTRGMFHRIANHIIKKKLPPERPITDYSGSNYSFCERNSNLLGGVLGAVMAILVSMVIFAPIMGNLHVIATCNDYLLQADPQALTNLGFQEEDIAMITACSNDLFGNLLYEFGGKCMFRLSAQSRLDTELFLLSAQPLTFADGLSFLTAIFTSNYRFNIATFLNIVFLLLVLIGSPVFYVYLTARALPRRLLVPHADSAAIKDRGVRKYLFPNGRAITYLSGTSVRPYIPQYIVSDHDGRRFLKCKLDKQVRSIRYRILPFDVNNHPLDILEVADPVTVAGVTSAVSLPSNTAYISLSVQEVNGEEISGPSVVGFSPVKVGIFGAAVVFLTLLEAYLLGNSIANLLHGFLPDLEGISQNYPSMILPAFLLAVVYAAAVFFFQFTQDRKFLK